MGLHRKQVLVVFGALLLTMGLYSLEIKGLVNKPASTADNMATMNQGRNAIDFDFDNFLSSTKKTLTDQQLTVVERAEGSQNKDALIKQWRLLGVKPIEAFYLEQKVEERPTLDGWLEVGSLYLDVAASSRDSLLTRYAFRKSTKMYQEASKIAPENLDVQTGLGVSYVSGGNPMQGIKLLLEVVKQDPKNVQANLNLGLFSIRSGQYEKAVERFISVLEVSPSSEVYFYLAESYKMSGKKEEAIKAYEKCKKNVKDPKFIVAIDGFIKELRN